MARATSSRNEPSSNARVAAAVVPPALVTSARSSSGVRPSFASIVAAPSIVCAVAARAQHDETARDLAQNIGIVKDRAQPAILARSPLEGGLPVAKGRHINLFGPQHLFQLRTRHHHQIGGILGQALLEQVLVL